MLALAAAVLCWPLAAGAAPPPADGQLDLASQATARIDGAAAGALAGWSVAGAGDVNGDGRADVIVSAPGGVPSAYVVFGRAAGGVIPLGSLGVGGFQIVGGSGVAVAGAGDVNGDGRSDVIVGFESGGGPAQPGSAFVVFGKTTGTTVNLGALGADGFRIDGAAGDHAGAAVAGVGDMNGDGLSEVVVGAPLADNGGTDRPGGTRIAAPDAGAAYIVFGKATTDSVTLGAGGGAAFAVVEGAAEGNRAGSSVGRAGDVNGDGRNDVVVGSPGANGAAGSAAVVFGVPTGTRVGLEALGARGFVMAGAAAGDGAGTSVAGVGDVDGNGVPDVVVGAPFADNNGRGGSGSAYIVLARAGGSSVNLGALGVGDVRLDGAASGHAAGFAVAGPGDVSGDGRTDVLLGALFASNRGRTNAGSSYVVYGKPAASVVDLSVLSTQGLLIDGAVAGDQSGHSLAGAGDFNGDGTLDVIIGARLADNPPGTDSGSAFVVNGYLIPAPPPPPPPPVPPPAPVPPPPPPPCGDCDGDGYLATVDCNEANATIHPGAVDVPGNAVDEDCTGGPAPYPRLDSTITYSFSYRGRNTVITELLLRTARAGSTIRMTCTGRGCRFKSKTRKVAKDARRVDLSSLLRTSRLRPGARLEVRVTKRATVGIMRRLTMRVRRRPTQADLCLPPGTSKPTRCPL